MIPYGADTQRNAIVQALMRVANPPPTTGMPPTPGPGMGGAGDVTRSPGVLAPPMPGTGGGIPGGGTGVPDPMQAANPSGAGAPNPQPFMQQPGSYAPRPQTPGMQMPQQLGGAPLGPVPNSANLVGVQPPGSGAMPGTQLPIDPTTRY